LQDDVNPDDTIAMTAMNRDPLPSPKQSTPDETTQELELLYVNVPGQTRVKTKPQPHHEASTCDPNSIYDSPRRLLNTLSPSAYGEYAEIREDDFYDEIGEHSEVSEALYGTIGSSNSDTGTGSGEGDPREWLPTSTKIHGIVKNDYV